MQNGTVTTDHEINFDSKKAVGYEWNHEIKFDSKKAVGYEWNHEINFDSKKAVGYECSFHRRFLLLNSNNIHY